MGIESADLETNTVAGMETSVNTVVGMDTKLAAGTSGNVSAAGAEMILVAGASTEIGVEMGMIVAVKVETVLTVAGTSVNPVGTGMVLSVCAVASVALVGVQHIMAGTESETEVVVVVDVHAGMGLETVGAVGAGVNVVAAVCAEMGMVVAGASTKTAMSAGPTAGQTEGKTGLCAACNVGVVGQDMNTMWGVSSNLGVGTGAGLTLSCWSISDCLHVAARDASHVMLN